MRASLLPTVVWFNSPVPLSPERELGHTQAMNPIPFSNTFARLPERFHSREAPTPVADPSPVRINVALARRLGIDAGWLSTPEAVQVLAGNRIPPGAEPIASVYAGHQFGGWNPRLGDGRAVLLGEVVDGESRRFDIQLKGSGRTPYSRGGDGRSPLGPVLREYIVSEAMAAFGIPTTRSLAAVATGERVYRGGALPGAVLTRVARSHIRVGHFQYFLGAGDPEAIQLLADHVVARDYPEIAEAASGNAYLALLKGAVARQARLIAQWQLIGFVHGVMNTDNMLICGETIDYGPCAFMEEYDPTLCLSSIDHGGRYAYRNQPAIAQWNLARFAECLLPLLDEEEERALMLAREALGTFVGQYETAYHDGLHRKFGLETRSDRSDRLIESFMSQMTASQLDFTLTFRHLADLAAPASGAQAVDHELPDEFGDLLSSLRELWATEQRSVERRQEGMYAVNPSFIPRNHRVEEAIRAAEDRGDLVPFQRLVDRLAEPFVYDGSDADLTRPAVPQERVHQTFCGT